MSHFTSIETQIKDIDALRDACAEMGLVLIENGEARGYGENRLPGRYVIRLKGPYDIAVNPETGGRFGLTTDWWGGHVEQEVGHEYGRLLQLYGVHKAAREARKHGYRVRRTSLENGAIRLAILGGQS
jgi:hypothetical protein